MKKSQKYYLAMTAVLNSNALCSSDKLEILETLIENRGVALYSEAQEEKVEAKNE